MAESLLLYLLQSSAAIAVSGGIIMFIRKAFDRYLTAETRYRLWFLLLILAAAPFLAEAFPWLGRLTSRLAGLRTAPAGDSWQGGAPEAAGNIFTATGLLHDFSVSVSRKMPGYLAFALLSLWIGGAVLLAVLTLISAVRVNFFKKTALPVRDAILRDIFEDCKRQLGIRRDIPLRSSSRLRSPVTAGIAAPCVLLPASRLSAPLHISQPPRQGEKTDAVFFFIKKKKEPLLRPRTS